MQTLLQELRYGVRLLLKSPGFTLVAVLTLGLGIGANNAIFSVIHSVLIRALPYPDPDQLVTIWETLPNGSRNGVSAAVFLDWRDHSQKFSHLALVKDVRLNLTGSGTPENLQGVQVSADYLRVLGINPTLGRGFAPDEDKPGSNNRVVLLAHSFWERRFGGDPKTVGRTVLLNQIPHTVIGVLPRGALLREEHMFVLPFTTGVDSDTVRWVRGYHCCSVLGRMKPGVGALEAQSELRGIRQQLAAQYPPYKKAWSMVVNPLQEDLTGDVRPTLLMLLATSGLVLLIACANVSNLLLARGNVHARELAIRRALGATPGRIVRQLLIESLLIALGGCVLGLVLAAFGIELLRKMLAGTLPQLMHPELNTAVLLFSVLVAAGCAIVFGLVPALRLSHTDLNSVLKESDRGLQSKSKRRSQAILVGAEFSLTFVLLVGAGLFLRSFVRLLDTDAGFQPSHAVAFDLALSMTKYPKAEDQQRLLQTLSERVAGLPGVEAAGAITNLPLSNRDNGDGIRRADRLDSDSINTGDVFVSGNYFQAMGIPLQRGRFITESDNLPGAQRVLVIDATVASSLFPGEDALGKQVQLLNKSWEVVGVVAPVRHEGIHVDPRRRVYGARVQASYPASSMVVRSTVPPATLAEAVRKTILEADPDQPVANIRTMEEAVKKSMSRFRATLILLGLFAIVAVGLACVGIYGVMSYAVGQRARELSIRSALGATRGDIIQLVLNGGMRLSLIGIGVGLVASYFLTRLVEKLLFQVKGHDPLVFAGSVGLLVLVAAVSIFVPARRAAGFDPIVALRSE